MVVYVGFLKPSLGPEAVLPDSTSIFISGANLCAAKGRLS